MFLSHRTASSLRANAVKSPGAQTMPLIEQHVDDMLLVSEEQVEQAIFSLLEIEKTLVEGAGAASLAAVYAHKTEFEGRFGFTFGNFLKRLCTIAWTFTGIACVIIYLTPGTPFLPAEELATLNNDPTEMKAFADKVFGVAAHDMLPRLSHGLIGLLFAALLAAIMSTCDAQMVVGSGLFTENVYKRYINRAGSEKHYVWIGRLASLGIVALSLLLMTQFEDAIQVLNNYVNAIPAFIGLAFWFGFIWRGYTPLGVWASTLTTVTVWYLTQTHTPFAFLQGLGEGAIFEQNIDYLPSRFREWLWSVASFTEYNGKTSIPWQYVMYLGSGAIAGIAVSLLTRRTPESQLDHFYTLVRTPVRPGEEVAEACTLPENPLPQDEGKLIPLRGRAALAGSGGAGHRALPVADHGATRWPRRLVRTEHPRPPRSAGRVGLRREPQPPRLDRDRGRRSDRPRVAGGNASGSSQ